MEDVLVAVEEMERPIAGALADLFFEALDSLSHLVDGVARGDAEADVDGLIRRLVAAAREAPTAPPEAVPMSPGEGQKPEPADRRGPELGGGSIRVGLEKLDRLANFAVEMTVGRMRAAEARRGLQEALALGRTGLRNWAGLREVLVQAAAGERAVEAIRQVESWNRDLRDALQRAWDELEEVRIQHDLLATELRHQVLGIRMQALGVVFETFPRAVRDLAREFGKEVELSITGGEVELDRRIIEALGEPLLHLIRNALDHGLEAPAARGAAGKPVRGRLTIRAWEKGNRVVVEVEDDGAGIDPAVLRETAVRKGHLRPEAAEALSDADALGLIFRPGFSTSRLITDVSGRGVGMEVVQKAMERLRGSVAVDSTPGRGTRVTLDLPLSLAMLPALLVRTGGVTYALPAASVERVARFQPEELQSLEGRRAARLEGETIPLVELAGLLGVTADRGDGAAVTAVLLRAGVRRVGFVVEEVLDEGEVVLKELGSFLGKVEVVAGATVLGSGEVVLILDPATLIRLARGAPVAAPGRPAAPAAAPGRLLVVEDSLIARDLERTILESAGYQVEVAVDGVDALEKLGAGEYDLVITDIEMPRMDGFALLERIRAQERTRGLPVIVVTNREKAEDKRRGMELGADAYILKSSFNQASLLDTIRRLSGAEAWSEK
jgi:two-component system chemotaxis sensor kinase CheA